MSGQIPTLPNDYCRDYEETTEGVLSLIQPPICQKFAGNMECEINGRICYWSGRPKNVEHKEVKQDEDGEEGVIDYA